MKYLIIMLAHCKQFTADLTRQSVGVQLTSIENQENQIKCSENVQHGYEEPSQKPSSDLIKCCIFLPTKQSAISDTIPYIIRPRKLSEVMYRFMARK